MATTTNFGWETPDDTDLVKDGALAIRTLGSAIDTSLVDLKGGTTGQVLAKNSNTDMDFVWTTDATGIPATIFDAKGDLIVASAADAAARLAVGTNGHVLTADSTAANGIKWAAPAGGGKVLQVVQGTSTTTTESTSTTFADTGLSASITPSSTSSKILVLVTQDANKQATDSGQGDIKLVRASTDLASLLGITYTGANDNNHIVAAMNYLDSPSTTSSITYKTQLRTRTAGVLFAVGRLNTFQSITLIEIGA